VRHGAVFVGAILLALVAGHLLRDTPGYAVRQADGSLHGDIDHYVYWTRLVTLEGMQAAYSGTWPETYAVYPPVTLYAYQAIGNFYRLVEDPGFDPERAQRSQLLRQAIKLVALTWHVLTAIAIYAIVRFGVGPKLAAFAAAAYVLNPAALFDVAHWGQPDGAHSLFSVLAIGLLPFGAGLGAGVAMALAALAKPQAWALVPLFALGGWRYLGLNGLIRAGIAATLVSLIVIAPFLLSGRLPELLGLPGTISSVMPVVSANAHNLWWLVLEPRGLDSITTPDAARLIGPLTFRLVAAALVLVQLAVTCVLFWTGRASLAEAAALGVLGWFVFTTQAHENHPFFVLPLLSLAWPSRPTLLIVFGVLSVTLFSNMLLHDQLVLEGLGLDLEHPLVERLRLANASVTVLCFAAWAITAVFRAPQTHDRHTYVRSGARLGRQERRADPAR
jgi:Gpi18-like mannosyltransferase